MADPIQSTAAVGTIFPIVGIMPIGGIFPVPQVAAPGAITVVGFRLDDFPTNVQSLFLSPIVMWRAVIEEAIKSGINDLNGLTDLLFFKRHPERMNGKVGKQIDPSEPLYLKLRAEWNHCFDIISRRVNSFYQPDIFLPSQSLDNYETYVTKATTGLFSPLINGRNRITISSALDVGEAFEKMRDSVQLLGKGDFLYVAGWQFMPAVVPLNPSSISPTARTWWNLLQEKAIAGVTIRVIISIHPDRAQGFNTDLGELDKLILSMREEHRDQIKYIGSRHPAKYFGEDVGDHHQKFMVMRQGKTMTAYCGGLDLAGVRAPAVWRDEWVWHDLHSRLDGLIVKDLEREFVRRWNRERGKAKSATQPPSWKATLLKGWADYEELKMSSLEEPSKASSVNSHKLQMIRTVSNGATLKDNRRDDIWQVYFKLIARAKEFLYLENQYFHEPKLADAIVMQLQAQPELICIIVLSSGTDDPPGEYSKHCLAIRHDFFSRLLNTDPSLKNRIGVFTLNYNDGIVHSKLILVDDKALSLGSANANQRGFFLDTELNVVLDHPETVRKFRIRLWEHDLGVDPTLRPFEIAKWKVSEFLPQWKKIADENKKQTGTKKMFGEAVVPYDPLAIKGSRYFLLNPLERESVPVF